MSRGIEFSEREKAYIRDHAFKDRTWGALAADLGRLFPEDNGGERTARGVQGFALRERGKRKTSPVPDGRIPLLLPRSTAELARIAGFTLQDLEQILLHRLQEIIVESHVAVTPPDLR